MDTLLHDAIYKLCKIERVSFLVPEISTFVLSSRDRLKFIKSGFFDLPMCVDSPYLGGQTLARWILDNPKEIEGKTILDFGSGSGLVAIAATMSGAKTVMAIDSDPFTATMIEHNAEANNVSIQIRVGAIDALAEFGPKADIVTACDVFYSWSHSVDIQNALIALARSGSTVFAASYAEPAKAILQLASPLKIKEHFKPKLCVRLDATTIRLSEQKAKLDTLRTNNHRVDALTPTVALTTSQVE